MSDASEGTGRRRRMTAFAGLVLAVVVYGAAGGTAEGAREGGRSAHQRQLLAQVQDAAGAPRAGTDPARQQQTSLAAAAGRPAGPGTRAAAAPGPQPGAAARPGAAAGPRGRPGAPVRVGDARGTGVLSSGCLLGYGTPGAQCLPSRGPGNTRLTCAHVVTLFPGGIPVTGVDRLRLDTDRDRVACGPRDAGVSPPVARRPPPHQHE